MSDSDRDNTFFLRHAEPQDMELLYQWANDEETRLNSFNSNIIPHDEHVSWFESLMADPKRVQYILMREDIPVGQIRLELFEDVAEISYSIACKERNKGYGREIIKLVINAIKEEYPYISKVKGFVKPHNKASITCFEKNGFYEKYRSFERFIECQDHEKD